MLLLYLQVFLKNIFHDMCKIIRDTKILIKHDYNSKHYIYNIIIAYNIAIIINLNHSTSSLQSGLYTVLVIAAVHIYKTYTSSTEWRTKTNTQKRRTQSSSHFDISEHSKSDI